MNYYKRHLGDYAKDTRHLSLLEHGAYCLLLDYYYSTEKPIPDDRCERIAGARTEEEIAAVRSVLKEFFIKDGDVWRNKKADEVIAEAASKSAKARASAAAKWGESGAAATRSQRLAAARAIATHTKAEWLALVDACGNACVRCGAAGVVKDHIIPIYQGGSDGIDNLQPLCKSCNSSKGPENKDFRPPDWRERLLERLRNACETPASHKPLANSHKEDKEAKASLSPTGDDGVPACPHEAIVALYHEILPANPRIRVWDGARASHLRARWREDPKRQSLDYWRRFFEYIAQSPFLTGRTDGGKDGRPFLPGLDWMVKAGNFAKIIEGRYHEREAA